MFTFPVPACLAPSLSLLIINFTLSKKEDIVTFLKLSFLVLKDFYMDKVSKNSKIAELRVFINFIVCLAVNLFLGQYFDVYYCATKEYGFHSFPYKVLKLLIIFSLYSPDEIFKVMYFFMAMTNQRFLYYTPWCITDGAVIASGLGYGGTDPTTKKPIWDYITSIRIREVELGVSPNTMMTVSSHTHSLMRKFLI